VKHKHNWQFVRTFCTHSRKMPTDEYAVFVCECGKIKSVELEK